MPIFTYSPSSTGPGMPGRELQSERLTLGGITLGVTDDNGVDWVLEKLTGWDLPASTGSAEQRANDHGGWLGRAFYAPRILEVEGVIDAGSWAAATSALDDLFAAVPLQTPQTLTVTEGDRTLQAEVRQEGDPLTERAFGWVRFSLSLIAPDPRKYSPDLLTVSTGLPQTSGGFSFPVSFPLTIGATVDSGVLIATNEGNMGTPPTLRLYGPTPPDTRITHRNSGRTLRVPDAVPAGRFLLLDTDTDKRRALLDGTAVRRVTGAWFEYDPGANEVALSAPTYEPSALLVSEHRNAFR